MSKQVLSVTLALCVMSTTICKSASAGVVTTSGSWGGRTYSVVALAGQTWDSAELDMSSSLGGTYHLATITSQEEHDFVKSLFTGGSIGGTYWLGGFQPEHEADPSANWSWVTGETWDYTNWSNLYSSDPSGLQPDDYYGLASEQHLAIWSHDYRWNDEGNPGFVSGYVAETASSVPEPTTLAIWGTLGALGLIAARRRRRAA